MTDGQRPLVVVGFGCRHVEQITDQLKLMIERNSRKLFGQGCDVVRSVRLFPAKA